MHTLRAYLELARGPQARRPLAGSLLGRIPESIASVSLVTLVRSATGSYTRAGIVAAGFALGSAVAAPLAGKGLDRVSPRGLLTGMASVFAATLIAIVISAGAAPAGVIVALAAIAGLARPPLDAAMRALWPRIVAPERLQGAYSLDATAQELIWIAGPLLLAALLVLGGPGLALIACAALSLAGTLVYASSMGGSRSERRHARGRLRSVGFASLLIAAALYGVAVGILTVTLIAFSSHHHARAAVGLLIAVWGLGSIIGGLSYGTTRWKSSPELRALALLALFAALLALLASAPNLWLLALLMLLLGLPLSPWLGTLNEAVQRLVPTGRTAEAFTWTFAVITAGLGAGNALGGALNESMSTAEGFLLAAAAAGLGATVGILAVSLRARSLISQRA